MNLIQCPRCYPSTHSPPTSTHRRTQQNKRSPEFMQTQWSHACKHQSVGKHTNYIKFSLRIYGVNGFCNSLLLVLGRLALVRRTWRSLNNNAKSDAQQHCSASTKKYTKKRIKCKYWFRKITVNKHGWMIVFCGVTLLHSRLAGVHKVQTDGEGRRKYLSTSLYMVLFGCAALFLVALGTHCCRPENKQ